MAQLTQFCRRNQVQGIWSAFSEEYGELQIIDVTHSSFRVDVPEKVLAAMSQDFIDSSEQRERVSAETRELLGRSILGRALASASGSYLPGMSTYLMKLGPKNLWNGSLEIDRKIASSLPALASRVRLQDMAQMLANGLEELISTKPDRPLSMVNIAGGTAADSWNALLCLRAGARRRLDGRSIRIIVLDREDAGPKFGARAIRTLQEPGAPLHGLQVEFSSMCYDWSDPHRLALILQGLGDEDAACAVSSEGGLFEYGSDYEVIANLLALRSGTPPDVFIVGSVTRDCQAMRAKTRIVASRPRTIDAFRALAKRGGWKLNHVVTRPFSYHVRLVWA